VDRKQDTDVEYAPGFCYWTRVQNAGVILVSCRGENLFRCIGVAPFLSLSAYEWHGYVCAHA